MPDLAFPPTSRRASFLDRRMWFMAVLGFASGLPLALSGFTLRQWLTENHVSNAAIGLTAYIGLAYTLKFLWSPALDSVQPPGLLARLGRRRGWLVAFQPLLCLACLALAVTDPAASPLMTIAAAGAVAVVSASQDIVIDAWRIETFEMSLQGAATAVYVWGYRIAMLVSGWGVLRGVSLVGWHTALLGIAALMAILILFTLAAPEPAAIRPAARNAGLAARMRAAVIEPLRDFLTRPGAIAVLAYVALFKVGESMAGVMLPSLYHALGFARNTVADAGWYSLVATLSGIALGGWLVARFGLARALISTGFIQMAAMGMYVWLARAPGNETLLYGTVATEAFLQGLADAAFLTYLASLCSTAHTATHYALLTSLAALASHTVGGLSGFLSDAVGWPAFYTIAMFASLPGMVIMLGILRAFPPTDEPVGASA